MITPEQWAWLERAEETYYDNTAGEPADDHNFMVQMSIALSLARIADALEGKE